MKKIRKGENVDNIAMKMALSVVSLCTNMRITEKRVYFFYRPAHGLKSKLPRGGSFVMSFLSKTILAVAEGTHFPSPSIPVRLGTLSERCYSSIVPCMG